MDNIRKDQLTWQYPEIEPYETGRLKVSPIHEIYYEQSGNPEGKPVIFIHGGPGSGTDGKQRRFFDPRYYRIILFDQRGCGKSTPYASLVENTTWDLVSDLEKIREHLRIPRWQVFGGSWGSTLALAYTEKHPQVVTELIVRGIFLLRKKEIDWMYQEGASYIFPEGWEEYLAPIPEAERRDMVSAYHRRLTSSDKKIQLEAAKAWARWEGRVSKLIPDAKFIEGYEKDDFALAFSRIENHYFVNKGFFEVDGQLLRDANRMAKIPGVIIQGRYDMCCPIDSAWQLQKVWPNAEFIVVPDAGHSAFEHNICRALIAATDRFAQT